tara:strand:- start:1010 stop:1906 length:897 start_codon:yes stop_codon:yes gene_type:complete
MKNSFLFTLVSVLIFFSLDTLAQSVYDEKNSVYKKEKHIKKKKQPYTELREADIMWSRKIWREIDLRQKINHPFYYPKNDGSGSRTQDRMSLIDVIYSAAQEGAIKCYNPSNGDDEFRQEMSQQELRNIGSAKEVYEDVLDTALYNQGVPIDQATKKQLVQLPFDRNEVIKWRIKEEWFFDKQRSIMDVRIIGLAPMIENTNDDGDKLGTYSPLFWVWFPESRDILINAPVFNLVKNDAERRTYDDVFWKRMFSSTIIKEANVFDRSINQYMIGLDALLEANRIKEEIFNLEHDLWEY